MTTATWNPERVTLLRNFVGAGLTCSQIAAEIGVTRNAVIGKIHR
ncbi:MAG: GcrA family cell cycle regulator, partial [Xanthobacteraceae bacterium]